jgi:alpha-D-xyloside xylohydrolase
MHNYYTYLYNKTVFDVIKEVRGEEEAVVFARSATVGGQKFPVHWGGDCNSTYVSMAESIRGGLSLCLSGFGFWSHDIGGFEGTAPAHVYKRWLAFGLLSSHSRLHGCNSYRVPWLFGQEAVDVCRHFTRLKCRLMPYLYTKAVEANTLGIPMMRAMLLEFNDPGSEDCDRQYMLGDSLLVAPVLREDGMVDYYLPRGKWTHLLTGETVNGGGWCRDKFDFFSLPLFVRENTILPTGSREDTPDYDYSQDLTLTIFHLADGSKSHCQVCGTDGRPFLTASAQRQGDTIMVTLSGRTESVTVKQAGTHCRLEIEHC